jgi:hypothetical protein
MKGFLLLTLALFLFAIITPFGILWQMIRNLAEIPGYFYRLAISIDQTGNVANEHLFNDILVKKGGYKHGNPDETISSIVGKNKTSSHLTTLGKYLSGLLNSIEANHVEKAIEQDETTQLKNY